MNSPRDFDFVPLVEIDDTERQAVAINGRHTNCARSLYNSE
jgi:hypothetical protein